MSDKKLKMLLIISAAFLALSVVFCIVTVFIANSQNKYMEKQHLANEVELAKLQMPTFTPKPEPTPDIDESTEVANVITGGIAEHASEGIPQQKKIIVLDAGHGKSSSSMSSEEKIAEGFEYNESRGNWGEWRHYKNGTFGEDCYANGCTGLCPDNASCWYSMGNADRNTEPEINLNNAIAAKKYLEEMGYEVRMSRTSNEENPSMNKRVSFCFPNNDISSQPDADAYICIHSNAGGGSGTSYISLGGSYKQSFIDEDYVSSSNNIGQIINDKVAVTTGLSNNSPISSSYLILFNKCPIPIAYMEIGFFDDSSDLAILNSSSDEIGNAIAQGVDEYFKNN